jgi:hypothetical protein
MGLYNNTDDSLYRRFRYPRLYFVAMRSIKVVPVLN